MTTEEIPLKTLCSQLKIDPRDARRRLRKAKVNGHSASARWSFKKGSPAFAKARSVLSE